MDDAALARLCARFPASPKISRQFPRIVAAAATAARLRVCSRRIPITRVADLTPLDPLGLPVFAAVTPLARDLTTHMGKGPDRESARVSAMMEAVERVSAETYAGPSCTASLIELKAAREPVADPRCFELPDDTAFTPSLPLVWAEGQDLLGGEAIWVARDLVVNPPTDGVLRAVDTNGLASGNNLTEAVLHGLCEVIERDAMSQLHFADLFGLAGDAPPRARPVELTTLPEDIQPWLARLAAAGLWVAVGDMTTEIAIATFRVTIVDDHYPGPNGPTRRSFLGQGTDPCAEVAVRRALTEAVQSRVGMMQAARDSFNRVPLGTHALARRNSLRDLEPGARIAFSTVPNFASDDVREDLLHVLGRLEAAGARHVVAVELTRPELEIPVVRVRVSGLASFLGNRRRVGWRCLRHLL